MYEKAFYLRGHPFYTILVAQIWKYIIQNTYLFKFVRLLIERVSRKDERHGRKEEKEKGRQEGKRKEGREERKKLIYGPLV